MRKIKKTAVAVAAAISASLSVAASAQLQLEEVVVTAQKRVQSLTDVPISVSALGGDKLAEASLNEIGDITAYVPNLTMNETGIGTNISIRGISSGINQGFEQSVGMYVDDIYYGRAQLARAPFLDLERIEVLRGPQSILFGKNSIAGALSMTTANPTEEFEGSISALYEPDHGEKDVRLMLSGPISENVSGRLAAMWRETDGFYENTTLNRDEPQDEQQVIRGKLMWHATDTTTATLKVEKGSFDAQGRFLEIVSPVTLPGGTPYPTVFQALNGHALDTTQDFKRQSNGDNSFNDTTNVTLKVDWEVGDHTVTWTSGYNAYEYTELCDCDFTGGTIFEATTGEEYDQVSHELRLTSPGGETIDYIAGVFYQRYDLQFNDAIVIPTNSVLTALSPAFGALPGTRTARSFTQDSDLWSVFGQATWNISEVARLTVGGRFTSEDKEGTREQLHIGADGVAQDITTGTLNLPYGIFGIEPYNQIKGERSENKFTPLVTFQWDITDDIMAYATYTTGFKSGGYDARSNAHPDPAVSNSINVARAARGLDPSNTGTFEYEEEEATSYEFGAKMVLAGGAADLNVAVFRTEYDDLQTSQFDGVLGFNVTNAGKATTQGVELDGRWLLSEGLTLSGALAYLDFEYDDFSNSQCYFGRTPDSATHPTLCDLSGETREFTPELSANVSFNYNMPMGDTSALDFTLDVIYSDEYFASPTLDPALVQDAYVQVNARIALELMDSDLIFALVGKNLTDEEIVTFGNQAPLSTTLTQGSGTAYYAFYERPASVALQMNYKF